MSKQTNRTRLISGLAVIAVLISVGVALVLLLTTPTRPQGHQFVFSCTDPSQKLEVRIPDAQGGTLSGKTPFTVNLTLGNGPHTYIASATGYRPITGQFIVQDGTAPTRIEITALARIGGSIRVRSTAPAALLLTGATISNSVSANAVANTWTDLGYYQPGDYTIQASTPLGTQDKPARVGQGGGSQVEFAWGGTVVIEISPTNAMSLAVTLDGSPYTRPRTYSSAEIQHKSFVEISITAPAYLPWGDIAFLSPGEITTVTIALTPQPQQDNILDSYRFFWYTLINGMSAIDASAYPQVMTGTVLAQHTANIAALQSIGARSALVTVSPHTPTITLATEKTAVLAASYDIQITTIHTDGREDAQPTQHHNATFTMTEDMAGTWRVTGWTSNKAPVATVPPTTAGPVPTPGSGGNGGGPTPPPSELNTPTTVEQIVFESINCLRAGQGLNSATWDQELYNILKAPQSDTGISLADMASHSYRDTGNYPINLTNRITAAVEARGGYIIGMKGIPLSYMPARAGFAFDWNNYVNNACATGYGTGGGEAWTSSFNSIAIVIGAPYKAGTFWKATVIFVVR